MSYHTLEHTITSKRGWKRPLYSGSRVYRSMRDVMKRISYLARQYGDENVVHMPKKGDPSTVEVYIRIY